LVALPDKAWGTKGFEFWTFLALFLQKSGCANLLELGTGRSTITLAEYAKFAGARLTCLETNRLWFNKVRSDLRYLGLPPDCVKLVRLDAEVGWYELEGARSVYQTSGDFDFLFIDGPNNHRGNSKGIRDSKIGLSELRTCAQHAAIIIVDDVHRRHVLQTLDKVVIDPHAFNKFYYDYLPNPDRAPNSLCIMVKRGSTASQQLPVVAEHLAVRLYPEYDIRKCRED
jgi:predicted O-methyltransferase YrrM